MIKEIRFSEEFDRMSSHLSLDINSPELPLREELYYLCKNECPYMHICSDLYSDAKVSISKPRQGIRELKYCA